MLGHGLDDPTVRYSRAFLRQMPEPVIVDRDLVAAALPAYEVGAEIGRGGWGVVFEARHRRLGRAVAVKQLPLAFGTDPTVRSRFVAEAKVLASLDHPHIVPVYDYVEREGLCLLVMEKLNGGSVWQRFTGTGLTMKTSCATILAVCAGLHYAHLRKVLHRDVKPDNVLFSISGTVKVSDFGLAKVVGGPDTMVTGLGEVMGTPAYMAPEQAQALPVVPATDVYAAGVMLYELLSGRLPFTGAATPLQMLFQHVYEETAPLSGVSAAVPLPIAETTMRALAKDPADRYASAEEFGMAIAESATVAWGPGWLSGSGVGLMAAGMVAVTERASPSAVPGAAWTSNPSGPQAADALVRPTLVRARTPATTPPDSIELVPVQRVMPAASAGPEKSLARLRAAARAILSSDPARGRHFEAEVERMEASGHLADELWLLKMTLGRRLSISAEEAAEILRVTSEGPAAVRCDLDPGVRADEVRAAALAGVERWRTKAANPLEDRVTAEASEMVARCYEGIYVSLSPADGGGPV